MQKLWESFSTFAMSEIERSKERKGHKEMVTMNNETLGKKRSHGEPTTRAPTLKRVRVVKKMDIDLWLLQI